MSSKTETKGKPKPWPKARIEGLFGDLDARFKEAGDAERAKDMARYMKDHFAFYGVTSAARKAIQKEVLAGYPNPGEAELVAISERSFVAPEREHQYFAVELLGRHAKRCSPGFLKHLKKRITTKSWWDTVDGLAANSVGALVRAHPSLAEEMDRWIDSDDLWVARSALLHQLRYKGQTDRARLFAYCERRMGDRDFFLRKAVGWALRELSKTDAAAVRAFVSEHEASLSGLSRREALKWLERRGG